MACVAFDFTKYFCKKKRPIRINNPKIKKNTDDFGDIDDYECLERIGQGANGAVYRARHKESGEIVAVKLEFDGLTRSTMAEIKILRSLCHLSIVQFKQVALGDFGESVYVVMEYAEQDLLDYIHDTTAKEGPFDLAVVKRLMRELVEGVDYLHHDCGVMHRDLKPSNILVDRFGKLKICDFGLSRKLPTEFDSLCTTPVGTLWYRAPELLLGESEYTAAIDMWAVGCIMAELFFREVLFRGQSEIQQLGIINAIFEQPHSCLRDKFDEATRLRGGPVLTESGFDLLCRLLAYDSSERIKSSEAVNHRWFSE